jgi:hypothetical protein
MSDETETVEQKEFWVERETQLKKRADNFRDFVSLDNFVEMKLMFFWIYEDIESVSDAYDLGIDLDDLLGEIEDFHQRLYSNWKNCNHSELDPPITF